VGVYKKLVEVNNRHPFILAFATLAYDWLLASIYFVVLWGRQNPKPNDYRQKKDLPFRVSLF
jgi:hypothetical protein